MTDVTLGNRANGAYGGRMATSDTPIAEENYLPMLNPFAPGFFDNPYAQYAEVREQDPVHLTPLGSYACFRYSDVHRLLRDTSLSVEERHANLPQPDLPPDLRALVDGQEHGNHTMLNLDPPDHHRLRRLVSKVFTPKMIEGLRPRVQALVNEHLDAVVARGTGEMELIADLAFPLPFIVISEMIGVPDTIDRDELRDWSGALVKTFDPILTEDDMRAAFHASEGIRSLIGELIDWKRANPADDLLSGLIAAEDEGDRLTEEELREQLVLIYVAGHETTVNLIGNGTLALLRHRDQLELLQRDEVGEAPWVDELLRFDSPVQMSRRITLDRSRTRRQGDPGGHVADDRARRCESRPREVGSDRRSGRSAARRRAPTHVVRRRIPHVPRRAPRPARRRGSNRRPRPALPRSRTRDRHARVERPHRATRAQPAPSPRPRLSARLQSTAPADRAASGGPRCTPTVRTGCSSTRDVPRS